MHFRFKPEKVCSQQIEFVLTPVLNTEGDAVESNKYVVTHIKFTGGCQGNLSFISKILTGYRADYLMNLLRGHKCGNRPTSCMNEFSKCLEKAIKIMDEREWTPHDCL
nr:MAG TPA: TSCPD domain [Caudoviricetes sp.]